MKDTCLTCIFFKRDVDKEYGPLYTGKCHRFPPLSSETYNSFPIVDTVFFPWCGEYKQKDVN